MYKIAICDDEEIFRNEIKEEILSNRNLRTAEIFEYTDGKDILYDIYEETYFDIIILDISMRDMDGVATAKEIRENTVCSNSIIFFITSYSADIPKIVDVNPAAYIYKPINHEILSQKMEQAVCFLEEKNEMLEFVSDRSAIWIKKNLITYIEGHSKYIDIHTTDEIYKTSSFKIGTMMEAVLNSNFARCHNAYIINLEYVRRISASQVFLYNGEVIPVSRKYHRELLDSQRL